MILTARKFSFYFFIVCLLCFVSSCTSEKFLFFDVVKVKNYPLDTPFVYNNKININGKLSKDEKTRLQENLINYWSDSLFARRVQKMGIFYNLKNPPVFDTSTISTTSKFMNSFLFSQGYFNTVLKDTFYIDTFHKGNKPVQYRTTVIMNVNTGKRTVIDSVAYNLNDSILQKVAKNFSNQSVITPGKTPYSKEVLGAELDRLVALYRDRGYLYLRRDNLATVVDTTNTALLQLTLDPFEQAELIEEAADKRNNNPTASVTVTQRRFADTTVPVTDTSFLKKFHVGKVNFFPETGITELPDTILNNIAQFKRWSNRAYTVYYRQGMFRPKLFKHFNYLRTDKVYNDDLFSRTINTYQQIGSWKQVDTRTITHGDTVDLNYFLYPDRKQNITYNLEASRNTGDVLSSSNFFGLALNIALLNRNVQRQAVQSTTSFTNAVELSFNQTQTNSLLQAFQISLGQTYSLPRDFFPFKRRHPDRIDFGRTIISANVSYSDRQDYFRIRSAVVDYGWNWKAKNKVWQIRFPNIELYSLDTLPLLVEAFKTNPFLQNSFNTGDVISAQGNVVINYNGNHGITNYVGVSAELSGLPGLKAGRVYQYAKVAGEFRKAIPLGKTTLAMRGFFGIGYNYNSSGRFGVTLPFFKQFIAGGPNSMRAWALRQLGLGSSLLSDTSSTFRDRYGDMQLEGNLEYRYPLAHFTSVDINSALFVDAGNIWNLRKEAANPNAEFNINRLGQDIAIGAGTGLRFDFHYFLIRVDMGIKVKDPARLSNNGWMSIKNFTWRNNEFDAPGRPPRNNYAVQLGIGLPF
ncbi:MAG TPA: BamA/TamA family outer membrane protein [Parafilimonas sp.]|nr:BamA/TamA family outer membrane protein [Parafilimonas sp.]